ncbi:RNA polymerase factor sigma-54 [Candidatus Omnitrophota bacterium]
MAIKQRLNIKMSQRLALTPKMRQALYILQLPLMELKRFMQERMIENPLLEETEDYELKDDLRADEIIENIIERGQDLPEYFDGDNDNTSYSQEARKKQAFKETLLQYAPSLQEHLLRQLSLMSSGPGEYQIGQFIIGNLDENGYLHTNCDEIQEILNVSAGEIDQALKLIQSFDPSGVGAQNLKECLLIQLKQKNKANSLEAKIVNNFLTDLEKKKYDHLARAFKVSLATVESAVKEIAALEPKPGGAFSNPANLTIKPDVSLQKQKGKYEILLNDEELPTLQISAQYRNLLQDQKIPENTKKYLKQRLNSALWLIKAVSQRQSTLFKVARFLVETQKDFFEKGSRFLKPLTVEQIARAVKRDKSTVSRVLANKYIQTPFGIFALRELLSQGIKSKEGEVISTKNIKAQIEDLIQAEDPQHPLTDEQIVQILKTKNISLARRTCAKYREQLKVLPANLRKKAALT